MERVVMVGPAEGKSGVGDYIRNLATEMTEPTVQRVILPMGSNDAITFAKCAVQVGLKNADVIHVQHEYGMFGTVAAMSWVFFPILYVLAILRRTPVVVTVHEGLNENLVVEPLKWVKKIYLHILNRTVVLNAAHVVFLSENTANEFTESVPLTSYTVLSHGAHDERRLKIEKEEAKCRLGYDSEQTVITEPGYIEPRKGSDLLRSIAIRMDECEFLLAGGPAKEAYESYFEDIEGRAPSNMTVTGFLSEEQFHASIVASDLIVLPYQNTDQSGIINTVNQSGIFNLCATYGKPVVASNLRYFRTLERDWRCLRTCDFNNGDESEKLIREILADETERDRLSERIQTYAETHSFTKVAKRHERIYRDVACF